MTRTPAEITADLLAPFPPELLEQKEGKTYIPHELVRERLIDATDNQFDWIVTNQDYRDDGAVVRKSKDDAGQIIKNENGVDALFGRVTSIVTGTLTIPGLGNRSGIGTQVIEARQGEDAAYKGAESDALKRAAMAFGVGLYLYKNPATQRAAERATTPRQATTRTAVQKAENVHPVDGNATSKPNYPLGMTDDEFASEVRRAVKAKDSERIVQLIESAGTITGRWLSLIGAMENENAVAWLERQMQNKGITDPALIDAVGIRRGEFAA